MSFRSYSLNYNYQYSTRTRFYQIDFLLNNNKNKPEVLQDNNADEETDNHYKRAPLHPKIG